MTGHGFFNGVPKLGGIFALTVRGVCGREKFLREREGEKANGHIVLAPAKEAGCACTLSLTEHLLPDSSTTRTQRRNATQHQAPLRAQLLDAATPPIVRTLCN